MHEKTFEKYVCEKIRMLNGRAFKWVCPGLVGAPDRICIFPGGRIIFIELKRPGHKDGMSEKQKKFFQILKNLDCDVRRIGEKDEFKKLMEDFGYEI